MGKNVIEIQITAQNASALRAIRQIAEEAAQSAAKTKAAGSTSGDGFNKSLIEIGKQANHAEKALEKVENQAKNTAASIKKIGESRVQKPVIAVNINTSAQAITSSRVEGAFRPASLGSGASGKKVKASDIKGLADTAKEAEDAIRKIGDAGTKAGTKINAGGKKGADGLRNIGNQGEGILSTFSKIGMAAYGIIATVQTVKDTLGSIFGTGITYDKQMETAQLGVAGILMSMTKLNGEQLKLNQAMQISSQTLKQIQENAVKIGLPAEDMISGFQSILGPGLQAKMTMEEIVQITTTGTKAVKTMMGSMANEMQITQELRSMISGTIDMNSQVAKALGITNADVEKAKQTAGGLFKYLMDKMSGFKELATIWPDTMTGATERFKAMFGQASGSSSETVFVKLKKEINEITDALFVVDEKTKTVSFNPTLLSNIKEIVDNTVLFIEKTKEAGKVIGPVLLPPLNLVLSILKFIIQHTQAVATALLAWTAVQKAIPLYVLLKTKISDAEKALIAQKRAAAQASIANVTGANNAIVAIGRMEKALFAVKTAIRGLASATLWGAIATAAGIVVENIIEGFNRVDKWKEERIQQQKTNQGSDGSISWLLQAHEGDYGTVSSGAGRNGQPDPGGVSYGAYQFNSTDKVVNSFVEWLQGIDPQVFNRLTQGSIDTLDYSVPVTVGPGDSQFKTNWETLSSSDLGNRFADLQDTYARMMYYDPARNYLAATHGFDPNTRANAVQAAIFSTAIQHGSGGMQKVFDRSAQDYGYLNMSYFSSDEDILRAIYRARAELNPSDTPRYNEEVEEAIAGLAKNSPPAKGTSSSGNLTLKDEQQEAKALADAKIELANAISKSQLQEYIAKLKQEEQNLESRNIKTNLGTATDEEKISSEEYNRQKKVIATARTNAEIADLQQQLDNENSKLSNKNFSTEETTKVKTTIVNLQSQIRQKEIELQTTIDGLNNVQDSAMQALKDAATDIDITNLENKGQYSKAQKLRSEKQNRALQQQFMTNDMSDALKLLQENKTHDAIQADYTQAEATIENAIKSLSMTQEKLIQGVARGSISVNDALTQYQTAFDAKTKDDIATLKADLEKSKGAGFTDFVNKIELKLLELKDHAKDYVDKLLKSLDSNLEKKIQDIESNPDLTSMQRESQIAAVKREDAANNVTTLKALIANPPQGIDTDFLKAALANAEKLSERLNKLNDINYQVKQSFKESFESGLLTFLTDGITKCETLGEAFRNLASTVVSSIQRVYAETITKDIMSAFGLGDYTGAKGGAAANTNSATATNTTAVSINTSAINLLTSTLRSFVGLDTSVDVSGDSGDGDYLDDLLQGMVNGFAIGGSFAKFADGGTMDSGPVKGPGTGTSDSILAYLGNYQKFVGLSNGEYVIKTAAVKKFGTDFFDRLNSGLIPREFLQVKARFADGGSMGRTLAGPQELAATLASGDTNIHLKNVNLFDMGEIDRYMSGRAGEKVILNHMKNNATLMSKILKI
ncbi:hypothetical protein [Sporomusa aerivorans]|uniref:VgrG-related protein n=1 Tax=Sporomusa aerivorans TaxID=204936 RepID=UPI00352A4AD4